VILVDSSVWVSYFNGDRDGHTDYLDTILGVEPIAVGDLILTEVLQGFRSERGYRTARSLLLGLTVFQMLDRDRAVRAAENYRFLRRQGVTVRKTVDTVIATFCIDERLPLLYTDRDFEPFVGFLGLKPALPHPA
jgi:hypothetical protein